MNTSDRTAAAAHPAVVLVRSESARLEIAALTLLDRLIIALHRGGCSRITIVTADPLPRLDRSRAWAIPIDVVTALPRVAGPVLIATTDEIVQASDVRELLKSGGRLVGGDGRGLPLGLFPDGITANGPDFDSLPSLRLNSPSRLVTDTNDAAAASKALWASLTSSSDGFVDRWFNRPLGRPLSQLLIHTPVTPNMVSVASILIGLVAAWCFALGMPMSAILGAILFQASAVVDCVDGDVARAVFKESPLGRWLDLIGDQVVHAAVFAGIAIGVFRTEQDSVVLWLGASAIVGALIAFAVIVRGMTQNGRTNSTLRKLIDATTNRDFSVVVLALAMADRLTWFLWMAAIGSHLFWMTALALQVRCVSRKPSHA